MARYIDAEREQQKVNYIEDYLNDNPNAKSETYSLSDLCNVINLMITSTPTEDVIPVIHAHWVVGRYCSHCDCDVHDYDIYSKLPKYCPDCGAKMDKQEETI